MQKNDGILGQRTRRCPIHERARAWRGGQGNRAADEGDVEGKRRQLESTHETVPIHGVKCKVKNEGG